MDLAMNDEVVDGGGASGASTADTPDPAPVPASEQGAPASSPGGPVAELLRMSALAPAVCTVAQLSGARRVSVLEFGSAFAFSGILDELAFSYNGTHLGSRGSLVTLSPRTDGPWPTWITGRLPQIDGATTEPIDAEPGLVRVAPDHDDRLSTAMTIARRRRSPMGDRHSAVGKAAPALAGTRPVVLITNLAFADAASARRGSRLADDARSAARARRQPLWWASLERASDQPAGARAVVPRDDDDVAVALGRISPDGAESWVHLLDTDVDGSWVRWADRASTEGPRNLAGRIGSSTSARRR